MHKKLETKIITDRMSGGFCRNDESVRFILEIYKSESGELEGFISYFDNFAMTLSLPMEFQGHEISEVNKTIEISEEYMTSHPKPLVADNLDDLLGEFYARLKAYHFFFADQPSG